MYTLVLYYHGPLEAQTLFDRMLARPPLQVYEVNPQLFNPRGTLLVNLGIQKIYFKPNNVPSNKEELEKEIKRIWDCIIKRSDGIKLGRSLQTHGFQLIGGTLDIREIQAESIDILVKEEKD